MESNKVRARPHIGVPARDRACNRGNGTNGGRISGVNNARPLGVSEAGQGFTPPEKRSVKQKTRGFLTGVWNHH